MPSNTYRILRIALAIALLAGPPACAHSYVVEGRETPIHLWLTMPDALCDGRSVHALVYVGAEKAFEGSVRFPPGTPHVALPTLFLPEGCKQISVVIDGGALSASDQLKVKGEAWVQVVIQERRLQIVQHASEPRAYLGTAQDKPTTTIPKSSGR